LSADLSGTVSQLREACGGQVSAQAQTAVLEPDPVVAGGQCAHEGAHAEDEQCAGVELAGGG